MPISPGIALLDKAPTNIERASTPHALGVTLLNGLQGKDFALAVAPYWLFNHPGLTYAKYRDATFANRVAQIVRDVDVSGAVVSATDSTSNAAVGLRTNLFRIARKDPLNATLRKKYEAKVDFWALEVAGMTAADPGFNAAKDSATHYGDKLQQVLVAEYNEPAFQVSLAGAYAYQYPDRDLRARKSERYGAWLTADWRPKRYFEALLVARWQHLPTAGTTAQGEAKSTADAVDLGFRGGFNIPLPGLQRDWYLSLEYLRRFADDKAVAGKRVAFVTEAEVTDGIYLTGTFGEDFGPKHPVVALLGINFGFATQSQQAR
ncbi:hypothetical protein [Hymenobacter negativus]|uniref:TonB-dependent receptor n=1 Tax=Hymenobacter negativus TaxID=2795026 RepID=A0ABS3QB96_9BACT|nr:hypothetical protein [Hymenobacter negativus]MBO2008507.1 hypothetical protein [Hymenobacter negativus]